MSVWEHYKRDVLPAFTHFLVTLTLLGMLTVLGLALKQLKDVFPEKADALKVISLLDVWGIAAILGVFTVDMILTVLDAFWSRWWRRPPNGGQHP